MDERGRDEQRGRLGRLFAALVGTEAGGEGERDDATTAGGATAVAAEASHLDLEALSKRLATSPDPVRVLRSFVSDVRSRTETAEAGAEPSALETYLAERLDEADLSGADGVSLPSLRVVRPNTSGLFYLRIDDDEVTWLAKLKVLRVEAALNAALLAALGLPDADAASLEDLVAFESRCARSVVAQAARLAARQESPARGEWAVRSAISEAIESARLPWRLTARFRVNVAGGRAAFEVDVVPPRIWPATARVDGLGIVAATAEMRRRAASEYNLRVGVLLAVYALLVAPELNEVWVAGVEDSGSSHTCYYSARLTRSLVEGMDLEGPVDPWAVMRDAGVALDGDDRILAPVAQGFSLDDELLCPARRWDPVELSEERLGPALAHELGGELRRDLGIDEAAARRRAADELVRQLGTSTSQNVRALLAVGGEGAPEDVRHAARRCVEALIDGTLDDDPLAIVESFVGGGALERGVGEARAAFLSHDLETAEKSARSALSPVDGAGVFADAPGVAWRAFGTYADRVLYNRLAGGRDLRARLAPDAYLEGHLIVSACALARGDMGEALAHARLACEVAPLSTQASLHLSQCLEASGDVAAAADKLRRLLSLAHDGETIGLAYLRMSQLQWQQGNVLAAQACYQLACARLGAPVLVAGLAVVALIGRVGDASGSSLTEDQVRSALVAEDIPLAPTEEVGAVLLEASGAAIDAELFGVGRDLVRALCSVLRDDVVLGVYRSIEDEPDR